MPVTAAIDSAERNAAKALEERKAASKRALERLKGAPIEKQFKALGDTKELEPEHQLELRASLEARVEKAEKEAEKERQKSSAPVSAGFASRFKIWRSRLRYRVVPIAIKSLIGVAFLAAVCVAYARTPRDVVVSRYGKDVAWTWTLNGVPFDGVFSIRTTYARMRINGTDSTIRQWYSGVGYAEAVVPNDALAPFTGLPQ